MDVRHRRSSGVGAIELSAQGAVDELVRKIVQPKVPLIRHPFASTLHQQQPIRKNTVFRAALRCNKHPLLAIWPAPIKAASSEAGFLSVGNLQNVEPRTKARYSTSVPGHTSQGGRIGEDFVKTLRMQCTPN